MKKTYSIIAIFLLTSALISCGNTNGNNSKMTRDEETGATIYESDGGIDYSYIDSNFSEHKMGYEGKEVWIDDIYFLEKKMGHIMICRQL